ITTHGQRQRDTALRDAQDAWGEVCSRNMAWDRYGSGRSASMSDARHGDRRRDLRIDDLDKSIIVALEVDGRRPYRDIARDLDVAEATVRSRVNRLSESGLIKITAVG